MPNVFSGMLTHWVVQTAAMLITAGLIPRLRITSIFGAFTIVVALSFVNATIWDAALFFSIPDHITSHALLLVLANGVIFFVLIKLLPGIEVQGVLPALVAPLVFTVINILIANYARDIDWAQVLERSLEYVRVLRDSLKEGAGGPAGR